MQIRNQQRAGGFAADQNGVTRLDVLQARGQWPVLHLDAEELQLLLPIGTGDGIGAHERLARTIGLLDLQPNHHELAVVETEAVITGGGEAEVGVRPVTNVKHRFGAVGSGHAGK